MVGRCWSGVAINDWSCAGCCVPSLLVPGRSQPFLVCLSQKFKLCFQAFICLWRWMKVLIKRDTKGGSIGKKPVLTWTTSNHFSFPQETLYPSSSTIISRQAYTVLASTKLIPTCRKLSGHKGGYKGVAVVGLISPAPGNPCKTNVSQKRRRSSSTSPARELLRSSANMNFS